MGKAKGAPLATSTAAIITAILNLVTLSLKHAKTTLFINNLCL